MLTEEQQETKNEIELRKTYIGGSDCASILNVYPKNTSVRWRTAYEVWNNKVSDALEDSWVSDNLNWGKRLEPVIAEMYAERTGYEIIEHKDLIRSKDYAFIGGHIDRYARTKDNELIVLEIKSVSSTAYRNWKDELPTYYYVQLMLYLYVTGCQRGEFAIVIKDTGELKIFPVSRDEELITKMVNILVGFWNNHVLAKIPPPKEVTDLDSIVPQINTNVEADSNSIMAFGELIQLKKQIKELENKKNSLEEIIKKNIGEKEFLIAGFDTIASWKLENRTSIDHKKLMKENKDLYNQVLPYIKFTNFRKLRIFEPEKFNN
jgi:putative phage-type endonuclease